MKIDRFIQGGLVYFDLYGKCSKISYNYLFLFSNKMWVIMAGIHKMNLRIDPDQTASSEGDRFYRTGAPCHFHTNWLIESKLN